MKIKFVFLITLLWLQGCYFKSTPSEEKFIFPEILGLKEGKGLDWFLDGDSESLVGIEVDSSGNVYITGQVKRAPAIDNDIFLAKIDFAGKLIWTIVLDNSYPQINDSSGDQIVASLYLDEQTNSLYVSGVTKSSLVETNSSGASDIFIAKFTTSGSVIWVSHYGEETQDEFKTKLAHPGLDWSKEEGVGQIRVDPSRKLVLNFQTAGNFFETNGGAGTNDVGVMKVDPSNGEIIKGIQLGSETMNAWGLAHGITVDPSKNENASQGTFNFDGDKIVVPLRTYGSFVEENLNTSYNDTGYFIVDLDLNLIEIKQIGKVTYDAWTAKGNYAGSTSLDDQFRSVVVLGQGEYLFYGKTTGSLGSVSNNTDFVFARFSNGELVSIVQPSYPAIQEPRYMIRASNGEIYCTGHTRGPMFDDNIGVGIYGAVLFKVSNDGQIIDGHQVGVNTAADLGISDMNYNLVIPQSIQVKRNHIYWGFNNQPNGSNGISDSYLWTIPTF